MELEGIIISVLPLQTGQSRNGVWKKQEFIVETPGQYPKKVCMHLWGDKVDEVKIATGDKITASINIESREYNGRWYTDVRAWRVVKQQAGLPSSASASPPDVSFAPSADATDDLPF
ncbi:DUF3127 domain-containing protein [Oscillatoria amoena NRMC-F 0135]|nr:DUF3127 domain-containing protein [Oscillatoria amoena NRMC-F 0135]